MVFKVGDLVECVESGGGFGAEAVTAGKCYVIREFYQEYPDPDMVRVAPAPEGDNQFYASRFRLFDEVHKD
jgi:hypothetical protein